TTQFEQTAGSDIIVITSGTARKPGMSRDDLLKINAEIVRKVTNAVSERSSQAIIIVVTNPLDVMCYVAYRASSFPRERVIGMAGVLDASRFASFIARELGVLPSSISPMVLGGHGDSMVPCTRYTTVSGISVEKLIDKGTLSRLVQRTRDGGAEIVKLLKTGSAYYAPSAGALAMIRAIIRDQHAIMPCSVYCQGEYGIKNTFIGVPVELSKQGFSRIIEIELNTDEKKALMKSAQSVSQLCEGLPSR
ncbi:MAG: malate dehydrogenase, partial [Elusimicrobia bacterium]|nr:malate dehydrogenase [Elusimicrobiota bacterium]MBD3411769.1 malate dehydrogenase [Elusimicrobiota bacterium]